MARPKSRSALRERNGLVGLAVRRHGCAIGAQQQRMPPMPASTPTNRPEETLTPSRQKLLDRLAGLGHFAISAAFHVGLILVALFIIIPPSQQPEPFQPGKVGIDLPRPDMKPADTEDPSKVESQEQHRSRTTMVPDAEANRDWRTIGVGRPQADLNIRGPVDTVPRTGPGRDDRDSGPPLNPGRARTVVFLIDTSGSMFDRFDYLRVHLGRIIDGLVRYQKFELIFFSDSVEPWRRSLVGASPSNKEAAKRFIQGIVAGGQTRPEAAIRMGLAHRPELMIILSDGEFDSKVVLVAELNKGHATQIDTYAYEYGSVAENLKRIAGQNGGLYRNITVSDLHGQSDSSPSRSYAPMPAQVWPAVYRMRAQ
jgi:hypothetical protein